MRYGFALNAIRFCVYYRTLCSSNTEQFLYRIWNSFCIEYGTVFASNMERYCFNFEQHMRTHTCTRTRKQTNIKKLTPQIHHARTCTCTHACTPTHAHTPPYQHDYMCNHAGMIIFPIRYSNIATHKCS